MRTLVVRSFFAVLILLGAGDAVAQTCPALVGVMEEAIKCQRDNCKDLSVRYTKNVSKEGIYYVTCIQNFTFNVRSDEPFVAEIDQLERTAFRDPPKILTPCECLDKLASDFPACTVNVCKPAKAATPAPADPAPIEEPAPKAPTATEVEAVPAPPVDATVTPADGGGCALLKAF